MSLFNFFFKKDAQNKKRQEEQTPTAVENQPLNEKERIFSASVGEQGINQPVRNPLSFDDVEQIITELKNGVSVLVNVSQVSFENGQRFLDVLCGAIVALNGTVTPIKKGMYYFYVNKQ